MQAAFVTPVGARPATFVGFRPTTCQLPARVRVASRPAAATTTHMRIFDWKKRSDENYGTIPEEDEGIFKLHNIKPAPGSQKRKKRKGRGDASGTGARCGFGMRGQKSRSGRSVRSGFEGGQTPLYRRIPKYQGRPMGPGHKRTEYALIKPEFLNQCAEGSIVTFEHLKEEGIMTKQKRRIYKVVGGADVTVPGLTVKAHAFTTSAVEAIEKANGRCVLLSPTTGKDIILDDDEEDDDSSDTDTDVASDTEPETDAGAAPEPEA